MEAQPEQRTCNKCGKEYPLEKAYFPKLETTCRLCCRAAHREVAKRKNARRKKALDRIEAAGIDLYSSLATEGGSNIPHSAEVLERLFQYFGGVAGFSSVVVKQYWDSPPGGTARNRLIETIVRLVSKNVEQGGAKKPLTLWTEAELEAELEQRFQQALTTYKGITVDAKPQALPPPAPEGAEADSDPLRPDADGIPEGRDQKPASGVAGAETGSPPALQPDPNAGGSP